MHAGLFNVEQECMLPTIHNSKTLQPLLANDMVILVITILN